MSLIELAIPSLSILVALTLLPGLVRLLSQSPDRVGALLVSTSIVGLLLMNSIPLNRGRLLVVAVLFVAAVSMLIRLLGPARNGGPGPKKNAFGLIAVSLLSLWLSLVNAWQNPDLPMADMVVRLLPGVYLLILGLTILGARVPWRIPLVSFVFGTLIVNGSALIVDMPWRACDQFKCGPFGALYTGSYTTENSLALFTGAALVASLGSLSGLSRVSAVGILGLAMYATESRTSQLATVVAIFGLFVTRIILRRATVNATHNQVGIIAAAGLLATNAVGFFLIITAAPTDFSNRGNTWGQGISALDQDWPIGLGIDRWITYQQIGLVPPLFPHSQYLLLLFGGGILALALLFGAQISVFFTKELDVFRVGAVVGFVAYMAVSGLTEVYWNPLAIDSGAAFAVALLALSAGNARSESLDPVNAKASREHARKSLSIIKLR